MSGMPGVVKLLVIKGCKTGQDMTSSGRRIMRYVVSQLDIANPVTVLLQNDTTPA